jgi:hypothetical protein
MAFKPTPQLLARSEARIKGFRGPAIKMLREAIVGTNELELPGVLKSDHSVKRTEPSTAIIKPSTAATSSGVSSIPKSELLALQRELDPHLILYYGSRLEIMTLCLNEC